MYRGKSDELDKACEVIWKVSRQKEEVRSFDRCHHYYVVVQAALHIDTLDGWQEIRQFSYSSERQEGIDDAMSSKRDIAVGVVLARSHGTRVPCWSTHSY